MTDRSEVSTLPDLPTVGEERRNAYVRAAVLVLVLLFVLAGLTGLLGVKTATSTATSGDLTVEVTYPSRARPALAIPFSITVTRQGGFDGPIEVAMTTSYLAAFDENGLNPDPDSATTNGENTIWTFERPDGDTFTIWLDTRIEPGVQWRRQGTTIVRTGGDEVTVDHTTWIFP